MTEQPDERDAVDEVLAQWSQRRPGLDVSAMGVVGRVQRAGHLLGAAIASNLASVNLEPWEFDVLATLRRAGELTAGELTRASMVTSGAMTNRVDRLIQRGLVARRPNPQSRRAVLIDLTDDGRAVVDEALIGHIGNLDALAAYLSESERRQLAALLKKLLIGLGDTPPADV
ncbi:MarR family transcriptional regulator [Auritidibacter ignavus]|uniref:MarR family transcriptional regulator n=1 Tax=Auritidibacter ignavus TaxID=678932 RepID=A0AAJ6DD75_9MICC|nr:MarR family transcriptional regulator [Auritidibacter ignavus]WGH93552.1 MarR family transcriptional regulator [Auritidibacter ignavus]WHS28092.1 MarR family transcriptional regulator [Auritidibacter ignavus]